MTATINARLILATGSQAGLEAPLQFGFYMLGRHAECQIRPKTRSVSRRHCLLHCHENGLRAFDLNSTAGSFVNEERLEPHCWVPLNDGDTLRCGKISFRIGVDPRHDASNSSGEKASGDRGDSMLQGDAWQEIDIADFLDSQDEAARERRYGLIRAKQAAADAASELAEVPQLEFDTETDIDVFDEDFASFSVPKVQPPGPVVAKSEPARTADNPVGNSAAQPKVPRGAREPRRRFSGATRIGIPENGKLIAAVLATIAILTLVGYQIHQFSAGPSVQVIEGLD